ncbi:hypothetical protein ACR77U_12685 [Enterococcus faecium]|uniref:hypothetical protein n=1 Tax=Enterococcus faecium TaxID=1352 RepID=UPI003DA2790E
MEKKRNSLASAVIDELGGVVKVAGICKVRAASVSAWRESGIPDARLQYLRLAYPMLKAWALEDKNVRQHNDA